ncbi:MAG: OmpH family outer membrane protein [Lentisphaerae bacterium]|jgi:Skp family chaperone for outer membrane proteins|nr:OmpH family outer membrane protein [Lentisphaerota bacterium]
MNKLPLIAAVLSAAALTASAEIKIATVDMETVILSHPQSEENKANLVKLQKEFEAERDVKRQKIQDLYKQLETIAKEADNEALSEQERKKKFNAGRDLGQTIKEEERALRTLVDDLQRRLQEKELLLFGNVMSDVKFAINGLVKSGAYDLILDASAFRPGAPVPIVMYANPKLDVTDAVIQAIGGKKVDAKKPAAAK